MQRFPMHGFAKRVEDTVARAMAILRAKEKAAAKADLPASEPDIWQAMARWKQPASVRLQPRSAPRNSGLSSPRPRLLPPLLASPREDARAVATWKAAK